MLILATMIFLKYKPFVFIVETRTDFAPDVEYVGNGASLKSLNDLAVEKGYTLVVSIGNAYFVRNDLLDKFSEYDSDLTLEDYYLNDEIIDKCIQSVDENGNLLDERRWMTNYYKTFINDEKKMLLEMRV